MSAELDALIALSADYLPVTASLSPDTLAVLFYANPYLTTRDNWIDRNLPTDEVTDSDWDTLEAMVDNAFRELMTNMIGVILTFASSSLPPNVLPCDGATYNRMDYPNLYAVLDSAFIIDADTFVVPDLRDRVEVGEGLAYNVGDSGGEATHTLTTAEAPSHTHVASGTGAVDTGHFHTEVIAIPAIGAAIVGVPVPSAVPGAGVTGVASANIVVTDPTLSSVGGDGAHNNLQPYLALTKAIVAW